MKKLRDLLSRENTKVIVELIIGFSSLASAIFVLFTLNEIQIERNNAYMPDIVFETRYANISWSDKGIEVSPDIIFSSDTINSLSIDLIAKNIGVGTATK